MAHLFVPPTFLSAPFPGPTRCYVPPTFRSAGVRTHEEPVRKPALRTAFLNLPAARRKFHIYLYIASLLSNRYPSIMDFLEPDPTPRLAGRYGRGYLPHLRAQGRCYFVTFRLDGTLPQELLRQYQAEREALLAKLEQGGKGLSAADEQRLIALFSERIEAYLDAGRGECWLRDPRIGRLVADALQFFEGTRYDLGAWVIMPNHVHVMVRPRGTHLLDRIVKSWKGFTAREANNLLGRTGETFWAREYYDHLMRDEEERARLGEYIIGNPVKAGLCARPQEWPWTSAT
jgi:putative transposase